jgi:hypothetical protein
MSLIAMAFRNLFGLGSGDMSSNVLLCNGSKLVHGGLQ